VEVTDGTSGPEMPAVTEAGAAVRFATAEVYEIVQQLPESDGEYQYKIKSADDPHLTVAKESQLRRA